MTLIMIMTMLKSMGQMFVCLMSINFQTPTLRMLVHKMVRQIHQLTHILQRVRSERELWLS